MSEMAAGGEFLRPDLGSTKFAHCNNRCALAGFGDPSLATPARRLNMGIMS